MELEGKTIIEDGANGEIENVMVSQIGEVVGSTVEGKPIQQTIDAESLQKIADKLNEDNTEVLCDVDHAASRPGLDRDTQSAGWFHKFFVDPIKGLFAKLKLTKTGRELIENREYRFLSPTFVLGEDGKPVDMTSVSLTNTPAMAMEPILNQEPKEEKFTMEMTKEELVSLIKDTVISLNACSVKKDETMNEEAEEKPKEGDDQPEDAEDEKTPEEVEAEDAEKREAEADDEAGKEDEDEKEDEKEEVVPEAALSQKPDEVIKEESLNASPIDLKPIDEWKDLHGEVFFKWLDEHPEVVKRR